MGSRAPGVKAALAVTLVLIAEPGSAQRLESPDADTPETEPTLEGCRLPLPVSGNSGLADVYLERQQGRAYLVAPSISLRQTYTDNVRLDPVDQGERDSDWVTQVIPAISLCRVTQRLRMQADYTFRAQSYHRNPKLDDNYHQVNADATATLLQDQLYLDLGALYDQETVSTRGAFTGESALAPGNSTDSLRLRVSPYLIQDLGPVGMSTTRYTYNRNTYDQGIPHDERHGGTLSIVSHPSPAPLSWQFNARTERLERDDREGPDYFDDASVQLGYTLTNRLDLIGRAGLETTTERDGTRDRLGSDYWEAGFRWDNARTSIEARYGERFFGDTYYAAIRRRAAALTLSIDYRESQQISDRFTLLSPEDAGLPPSVRDPDTGETILIPPVVVSENEIYLSKRTSAAAAYNTARSQVRLAVFHDLRQVLLVDDEEERMGTNVSWRWQWMPRTTVTTTGSWEKIVFRDGLDDKLSSVTITVARLLSPRMQAAFSVRRQERISENPTGTEYTENAAVLEVTRMF